MIGSVWWLTGRRDVSLLNILDGVQRHVGVGVLEGKIIRDVASLVVAGVGEGVCDAMR